MDKTSKLANVVNLALIIVHLADEEHKGGRFFFKAVKEGDQVLFATEEELERQIWVNKLYTATGQSHKPIAPNLSAVSVQPHVNTLTRLQGGLLFILSLCYVAFHICLTQFRDPYFFSTFSFSKYLKRHLPLQNRTILVANKVTTSDWKCCILFSTVTALVPQ